MSASDVVDDSFPRVICNTAGLRLTINPHGSIRRADCGDILVNLFPVHATEAGPSQLLLRLFAPTLKDILPLLGPGSILCWQHDECGAAGMAVWYDLLIRVRLLIADKAPVWFWHVEIENQGSSDVACDLIFSQDLGLASYGAVRLNEYYVSHYIDHVPLRHEIHGICVASRQNQPMGGRYPAALVGSLGRAVSYATDALSVYGRGYRTHQVADCISGGLPGEKRQHEHSLVALQEEKFFLGSGKKTNRGFFVSVIPDHPEALREDDRKHRDFVRALPESTAPAWPVDFPRNRTFGWFSMTRDLWVEDLSENQVDFFFGDVREHVEWHEGKLLSFFSSDKQHVVLRQKEELVLRPHGMIMRSGSGWLPDESAMTSTAWMNGVFHSMVTQGHVSINRFLSTTHSYLGLFRSHGLRIMVEIDDDWYLLGVPSAFSMSQRECRWIYRYKSSVIEVRSAADENLSRLTLHIQVVSGPACRFLLIFHVALNGDDGLTPGPVLYEHVSNEIIVKAAPRSDVGQRFPKGCFAITSDEAHLWQKIGGDEMLWEDHRSRGEPYLCLKTHIANAMSLAIEGRLLASSEFTKKDHDPLVRLQLPDDHASRQAISALDHIMPWFVQNALVHLLSPRGLEQYSGGGWGTRDVCQGPMELMLALGRFSAARDLLLRVFRQQNADGDWPQWFMFFDRERHIRPADSHGDIVFWPVLALSQYLLASRDASVLQELLPYFSSQDHGAAVTIREHVERALALIRLRVIPGTMLSAYGHGDWNDSMQPAQAELRKNLCSAWTVTLHVQTMRAWADACEALGMTQHVSSLRDEAAEIHKQFQDRLVIDGVVTGLMHFPPDGPPRAMLHPRDEETGIRYSILPMIHAIINDLFTREQASHHLELIREHLTGPDGARLFDRPIAYRGGISRRFQRAETASFFGREIGLMYMHAHIRYAEALARFGDAQALWLALRQINPIGLRDLAASASLRQLNCYYSSSDADFRDRTEASLEYEKVRTGDVALEGGWRVYSSGSGIAVRLLVQCFLGLRARKHSVIIDPVIDPSLSGLEVEWHTDDHHWHVTYRVGTEGSGVQSVEVNGILLVGMRLPNPYRTGGICFLFDEWQRAASGGVDHVVITVG